MMYHRNAFSTCRHHHVVALLLVLIISVVSSANGTATSVLSNCQPIQSADEAFKYEQLVLEYVSNIDDIVTIGTNEDDTAATSADAAALYYLEHIEPMESNGIVWIIDAGPRVSEVKGSKEVLAIWESFATGRDFSHHTWSNFRFCTKPNGDVIVTFRYHGVVREKDGKSDNNIENIFGSIQATIRTDGDRSNLITQFIVKRNDSYTVG